ncbi:MAG: hypothetical protein AAF184_11135 [Pseudomonadota bacterium]
MTRPTQAGRFWSGAWLGAAMGLAIMLGLGWWLSEDPSPAAAPPPAATPVQPSSPTAPDPVPQFAAEPEQVAAEADPVLPVAPAPDEGGEATSSQAREGAPDEVEPAPEVIAATMPENDAPDRAVLPAAQETPLEEEEEEDAVRLRDRFDSLSEAMLAEGPADGLPSAAMPGVEDGLGESALPAGQWIDVWQPFTSPVSARGFADRLELLTGFTFRVERRPGDGLHQVAVLPLPGYEAQQMLQQIADRSGLAMVSP